MPRHQPDQSPPPPDEPTSSPARNVEPRGARPPRPASAAIDAESVSKRRPDPVDSADTPVPPQRRAEPVPTPGEPEEVPSEPGQEEAPPPFPGPSASASDPSRTSIRDRRIGVIGAGAMGGALCRGLIRSGAAPANRILVSDLHPQHVQALHTELGVRVADSNVQVAKYTDVIILAVKPSTVPTVLNEIAESLKRDGGKPLPLLISIAAGTRISAIEALLTEPIPVVRAMPNTPAQVGLGATAYCCGTHADESHAVQAGAVFEAVGKAVQVPEAMMDAVTALSGSGPAYVYLMIEALVDGGIKVGLPRDVAYKLAAQTVLGAAQMVIQTGLHPAQLRDMVTTPAGTTIAALSSLEHSGVRAALIDAVECAANRSRELG